MVGLHQDRAELHGERRGGADFPPSASLLNWAGSSRDAYHFLGAAAGRDNELTTTVNRDPTEDYDQACQQGDANFA